MLPASTPRLTKPQAATAQPTRAWPEEPDSTPPITNAAAAASTRPTSADDFGRTASTSKGAETKTRKSSPQPVSST